MELRFAYLLPVPAFVAGLMWTVLFTSICLLLAWRDGAEIFEGSNQSGGGLTVLGIVLVVTSLMLGMLPAIWRFSRASEEWDYQGKRPPLDGRKRWKEEKSMLAGIQVLPRPWIPTSCGMLFGIVFAYFVVLEQDIAIAKIPTLAWYCLELMVLFAMLARGIASSIAERPRRRELLEKADVVDLLDLSPQYRAGRYAVRKCMTWTAGATMASLFFLADSSWMTIAIFVVVSLFAVLSLIPAMLRLQYRIRNAKREAMEQLRIEIKPLRDAALAGKDENPGRLADLLSYFLHVEGLPELPFDKGKLGVASLYFAVPLGSWVWISVVQTLLGAVPQSG